MRGRGYNDQKIYLHMSNFSSFGKLKMNAFCVQKKYISISNKKQILQCNLKAQSIQTNEPNALAPHQEARLDLALAYTLNSHVVAEGLS